MQDREGTRHWDGFYTSNEARELRPPSQFGAFVIGEIPRDSAVLDVGCGSGRDALFFANHGHRVVGVDASEQAIALSRESARALNLDAHFIHSNLHDPELLDRIEHGGTFASTTSLLVYARFVLHAISEQDEDALFALVNALRKDRSVRFAVEFRTHRDANMPKATAQHFRRFIDPVQILAKAGALRMRTEYFVEGFGFAKYKADDAHVARCLFLA